MRNNLNLSIIIMSYNEEKNILNTLKDVLKNIPINKYLYEIIIMDDGSIDNTKGIVIKFLKENTKYQKFIKYYKNFKNLGQFQNIKRGAFFSKKDYICIIPGDGQILMHGFLENFKFMNKSTVFYGCPLNEIEGRGKFRTIISHLWRIILKLLFDIRAVYLAGLIIMPKKILSLIDVKEHNFFGLYEHGIAINQSRLHISQGFFLFKKKRVWQFNIFIIKNDFIGAFFFN